MWENNLVLLGLISTHGNTGRPLGDHGGTRHHKHQDFTGTWLWYSVSSGETGLSMSGQGGRENNYIFILNIILHLLSYTFY